MAGGLAVLVLVSLALWFVPNLPERLGWRWQEFWAGARRQALQLPDTLPTPRVAAAATEAPAPTATPALSATEAAPLPTAASPRPAQVELTGVTQVWQRVNNCGPATLAMALGYWGWKGTQANTANALKPDPNDRNVSPDEMAAYARKVGLGAEVRVGGTLERVQALLAAGFPVILETTLLLPEKGWEGHYTLVTGYSDEHAQFTTQDSLRGPNFIQSYTELQRDWRAFNYLYVVLYAPERQAEVLGLLGPEAEPVVSWQHAAEIARQETAALSGEDLAFAWFNLGTSLTLAGDWAGAAAAYDAARQAGLPWRMLWYQHGPLNAYYEAGRYDDVITLADATLIQADGIEEIYYWRGQARLALGDQAGAVADWRAAVHFNRNYPAPVQSLGALGLTP